ncbi:hypothetical protein [Teredinibacter turnerae]|uniref:hypothetical protein n=1 Tax=Teredinibacter turnerae TaxID=2426 RepID=UPI00035C89FD|nr:hypothetical protein [Teredinibacter turnerae]
MGFFDKKSSSTTNNNEENYNFDFSDNRFMDGDGFIEGNVSLVGDGNTVVKTDYGAINAAATSFSDMSQGLSDSYDSLAGALADVSLDNTTAFSKMSQNLYGSYDTLAGVLSDVSLDNQLTNEKLIGAVRDLNIDNNDFSSTVTERVMDAANDYAARSFDSLQSGFDFADTVNAESLDFASNTYTDTLLFMADESENARTQTLNEISKAYDLAATHSRSEGGEALNKAIQILTWGGIGLGGLFIVGQFVGKKH